MTPFAELLQQGAAHAWLFIPSAILLGALHGLEPGHSKTMMAAFIIAIRGTVAQAVMLGLAATFSHTLVVWGIALGGLYLFKGLDAEASEPYFQLVSGLIIIAMAAWMIWRVRVDQRLGEAHDHHHGHDHGSHHDHGHGHDHAPARHAAPVHHAAPARHHAHDRTHHHAHAHAHAHDHAAAHHDHGDEDYDVVPDGAARILDRRFGVLAFEPVEVAGGRVWEVRVTHGKPWPAESVKLLAEWPNGRLQRFTFTGDGLHLRSVERIDGPIDLMARVTLTHNGHDHDYDVSFLADTAGHTPLEDQQRGLELATDGYQDAHELAHANDIRRRFSGRSVTNWQILIFGLTGGLIPCPAAITVLLLCLQLQEVTLGAVLVLCFSIGLALTLVTVGVVAAISVRQVTKRTSWFSTIARRAPYVSGALILLVGLYVAWHGLSGIAAA